MPSDHEIAKYAALGVPVVVLVVPEEAHAWKGDKELTLVVPCDTKPKEIVRMLRAAEASISSHRGGGAVEMSSQRTQA